MRCPRARDKEKGRERGGRGVLSRGYRSRELATGTRGWFVSQSRERQSRMFCADRRSFVTVELIIRIFLVEMYKPVSLSRKFISKFCLIRIRCWSDMCVSQFKGVRNPSDAGHIIYRDMLLVSLKYANSCKLAFYEVRTLLMAETDDTHIMVELSGMKSFAYLNNTRDIWHPRVVLPGCFVSNWTCLINVNIKFDKSPWKRTSCVAS